MGGVSTVKTTVAASVGLFSGLALLIAAGSANAQTSSSVASDPIYSAVASCVSVQGSGSNAGSGCQVTGCPPSAALNITTWLPWFCDKNSSTAYPSEAWSSCVRWFFTGRWEGLVAQATEAPQDCKRYAAAVANAYAEIHGEWACLSGSLQKASGGRWLSSPMQKDVDFITTALNSENSVCASSAGSSGSGAPAVLSFGSSSSGSGSSGGSSANQAAISLLRFDTGSASLNAALAAGVQGTLPGCGFDGSGASCDHKAFEQFESFEQGGEGVTFPTVYPGSQAAHDLGLKGTDSGAGYVYCPSLGYWQHGTSCPSKQ